jgi:hypothetical protein
MQVAKKFTTIIFQVNISELTNILVLISIKNFYSE